MTIYIYTLETVILLQLKVLFFLIQNCVDSNIYNTNFLIMHNVTVYFHLYKFSNEIFVQHNNIMYTLTGHLRLHQSPTIELRIVYHYLLVCREPVRQCRCTCVHF